MITVIIPTLDEQDRLPALLETLRREDTAKEIIVVDGGSRDMTVQLARAAGVTSIQSAPGRGGQICRGVSEARGDVLLFLHADSIFQSGGLRSIEEMLAARPDVIGGNFRLLFDGDTAFSRWLTGFYGLISRIGLYYGDSGIFVRRSAYDAIGGMRPIPVMEDLDFVRRLERFGNTCCIADPPLVTSSRRFAHRRPLAIVYGWIKLHVLFWLGMSPDRLAEIYAVQVPP
jgi:rSAM/selenodomain-associated transferase 2